MAKKTIHAQKFTRVPVIVMRPDTLTNLRQALRSIQIHQKGRTGE
jgi:hypothetical protein